MQRLGLLGYLGSAIDKCNGEFIVGIHKQGHRRPISICAALGVALTMSLGAASLAQGEPTEKEPLLLEISGTVQVLAIDAFDGGDGTQMRTGILTPEDKWVSVTDTDLIEQLEPGMDVTVTAVVPQEVTNSLPKVSRDEIAGYVNENDELPASSDLGIEVLEQVSVAESPLTLSNLVIESAPRILGMVEESSLAHLADVVVVAPPGSSTGWIADSTISSYMAKVQARMQSTLDNRFTMQVASIKRMNTSLICKDGNTKQESEDQSSQWTAAAQLFGHSQDYYMTTNRHHLIVLEDEDLCNSYVGGYGNIGWGVSINFGGLLTFRVPNDNSTPSDTVYGIVHEMGHNFGLYHSERRQCSQKSGSVTWDQANNLSCRTNAYGDNWETMGSPGDGGWGAIRKYQLGILKDGEGTSRITTEETATGSVTLSPVANNSTAQQALVFATASEDAGRYGVEYRRSGTTSLGLAILIFDQGKTTLLQPADDSKYSDDFWLPSVYLQVGQTFTSADRNVSITLTSMTATQAVVNYTVKSVSDPCGDTPSSACVIAQGDSTTSSKIDFREDVDWFAFTAPKSGDYIIFSQSSEDTEGALANEFGAYIKTDDDGYSKVEPGSDQFMIIQSLTKDKTYYVEAKAYSKSVYGFTYSVSVCPLFTDVSPKHTFYNPICWAALTGVTTGSGPGTYKPSDVVNRGSMAAFLYRLAGSPAWTPPKTSPFADVTPSHQFYSAITWLSNQGITAGAKCDNKLCYLPSNAVNRGSMAQFLYRLTGSPSYTPPATSKFTDVPKKHTFYVAISWLAAKKIAVGSTVNGKLVYQPSNPVNRGSMAAFMSRLTGTGLQCSRYTNAIGC